MPAERAGDLGSAEALAVVAAVADVMNDAAVGRRRGTRRHGGARPVSGHLRLLSARRPVPRPRGTALPADEKQHHLPAREKSHGGAAGVMAENYHRASDISGQRSVLEAQL